MVGSRLPVLPTLESRPDTHVPDGYYSREATGPGAHRLQLTSPVSVFSDFGVSYGPSERQVYRADRGYHQW